MVAGTLLALGGCECRSHEPARGQSMVRTEPIVLTYDVPPGWFDAMSGPLRPAVAPEISEEGLPLVKLADLDDEERQVVDRIVQVLRGYYPGWDGDPDSLRPFYDGWYDTPEIAHYKETIDRRVASDRVWPAFFAEVRGAAGDFMVQHGSPPGFYVPSFTVVISRGEPRDVTAVFRLSMLMPYYDYYEVIRDDGRPKQIHLTAEDPDTRPVAGFVRRAIAKHFPDYRELPPRLGSVVIPTMRADSTLIGETTLAELLFSDIRNW